MRWTFVVMMLGLFALIGYIVRVRAENKKLNMMLNAQVETKQEKPK